MCKEHKDGEKTIKAAGQNERVVIPLQELQNLEVARKELWALSEQLNLSPLQFSQMQTVTGVIWGIANRQWPKA